MRKTELRRGRLDRPQPQRGKQVVPEGSGMDEQVEDILFTTVSKGGRVAGKRVKEARGKDGRESTS